MPFFSSLALETNTMQKINPNRWSLTLNQYARLKKKTTPEFMEAYQVSVLACLR